MIYGSMLLDGVELPYPPSVRAGKVRTDLPGLYRIVDRDSSRFYVGSAAKTIDDRWKYHLFRLGAGTHPNHFLQAIYNKDSTRLSVEGLVAYEAVERDELLAAEQFLLDKYFAECPGDFMNVNRLSTSRKGVKSRPETCEKISASKRGLKHTEEAKQKMREAKVGRKLSQEHRKKIGDSCRGKKINRPKGIYCLTLRKYTPDQIRAIRKRNENGESLSALAREHGTCPGIIRRIVRRESYAEVE